MPIEVEVGDQIVEFPDGTPTETIKAALKKKFGSGPGGGPAPQPEPPKPGVGESFAGGAAETGVPFAGSSEKGVGASLGAIPANIYRYLASEMSPRGLLKMATGPARSVAGPLIDAIADRDPSQLVPTSVGDAAKKFASAVGPGGEIVADLAEKGGAAVGTNTPESYARFGGNLAGIAAQALLAEKLPKMVELGKAGAAATGELPILSSLKRAKGEFELARLKQKAGRFKRKFGSDVSEARREKLLDRPAREAEAAAAEKADLDQVKLAEKQRAELDRAKAEERQAKTQADLDALKRDVEYRSELDKAKAQERLSKKESELVQIKERVKLADTIAKEQGSEAAKASRTDPALAERVKLADQISKAQADEVAAAAKSKGGSRTISDKTGEGHAKVDASTPTPSKAPAEPGLSSKPQLFPGSSSPAGIKSPEAIKLQMDLLESLSKDAAPQINPQAAPHLATLDQALAGAPSTKVRSIIDRAKRNVARAAGSGMADSDLASMVDEALASVGISTVQ